MVHNQIMMEQSMINWVEFPNLRELYEIGWRKTAGKVINLMNLYGYSLAEDSSTPMQLTEASIECSFEELDEIIDFLTNKRIELIDWAHTRDVSIPIQPDDYAELHPLSLDNSNRLLFLVNLESLIKKH